MPKKLSKMRDFLECIEVCNIEVQMFRGFQRYIRAILMWKCWGHNVIINETSLTSQPLDQNFFNVFQALL